MLGYNYEYELDKGNKYWINLRCTNKNKHHGESIVVAERTYLAVQSLLSKSEITDNSCRFYNVFVKPEYPNISYKITIKQTHLHSDTVPFSLYSDIYNWMHNEVTSS